MADSLHIAVVGLGFGESFVPIYQAHPNVSNVSICDLSRDLVDRIGDEHGIEKRFTDLAAVLHQSDIDAVHILTPVPLHVEPSLAVLESGRHCACAVPMATTLEDLARLIDSSRRNRKNYMMMETAVYTNNFLFAREMRDTGRLGQITFLQADYFQDLEAAYPEYWRGVPPMHYSTHAVAPLLALAKSRAAKVSCLGGGRLRSDICEDPFNPFPLQIAQFRLSDSPAAAQVTRAWYQTGHDYVESFNVYGDRAGFEWQQLEQEDPVVFELEPAQLDRRWRAAPGIRTAPPYRPDLLPPEIAHFATGGHGGAHPHLVHEFLSSIVEGRPAAIDATIAADWTAPGICAHQSSLQDGEWVTIPAFG